MRILLADDHDLVREAISLLFQQYFDDCEVAEAGALDPALELIAANNTFDLVLLDLRMPGMNGLEGLKRTLEKVADSTFVVLLSGAYRSEDVRKALEAGAHGFIPKTLRGQALANAVQLVLAGDKYLPSSILNDMNDNMSGGGDGEGRLGGGFGSEGDFGRLTPREREVLALLSEGRPNKDIARHLDLREITVKYHLKNIYRKLNVSNRAQAVKMALEDMARSGTL
ncbi:MULTISPECIES: response regulator transcription factor [unclassified Thalassospira]|uniref:response regulator n=1 Tax=unclassified Thalassospira TaxID=2648997 RepID=UPI0007A57DB3|nr:MULTISPECIES: response regulator transcription factor [unclassified Thalassospira]KZC99382.1 LuxR family transcriptional regulator [Thalassospira sp. MCCC 1A02898]ONH85602.1 LuxR family transcriptional regulator [Thalassospira sp. MCCC 1A02803]